MLEHAWVYRADDYAAAAVIRWAQYDVRVTYSNHWVDDCIIQIVLVVLLIGWVFSLLLEIYSLLFYFEIIEWFVLFLTLLEVWFRRHVQIPKRYFICGSLGQKGCSLLLSVFFWGLFYFLLEMIAGQVVFSFLLEVCFQDLLVVFEASHARACHSIALRAKNRYCSFEAVSTIGLRPIAI